MQNERDEDCGAAGFHDDCYLVAGAHVCCQHCVLLRAGLRRLREELVEVGERGVRSSGGILGFLNLLDNVAVMTGDHGPEEPDPDHRPEQGIDPFLPLYGPHDTVEGKRPQRRHRGSLIGRDMDEGGEKAGNTFGNLPISLSGNSKNVSATKTAPSVIRVSLGGKGENFSQPLGDALRLIGAYSEILDSGMGKETSELKP